MAVGEDVGDDDIRYLSPAARLALYNETRVATPPPPGPEYQGILSEAIAQSYRASSDDWAILPGVELPISLPQATTAFIGGVATAGALEVFGAPEPYFAPVELGRTPPLGEVLRVAAAAKVVSKRDAAFLNEAWRAIAMDDWSFDEGTGDVWSDTSGGGLTIPDVGRIISLPGLGNQSMPITQAGAFGGAAMAAGGLAARSLWGVLRAGGSRVSSFVINGVRGRMSDLWPAVRKYGGVAVAGALGIGADQLAQLLMQAPTSGGYARSRRRGISARDIRTTKRVVRFTNRMASEIGCVSRPRARYHRYRRRR